MTAVPPGTIVQDVIIATGASGGEPLHVGLSTVACKNQSLLVVTGGEDGDGSSAKRL